jgi:hypothetical protein
MAYTFTEVDTFALDNTFDSLYADSINDMVNGTVNFDIYETLDEKKQFIIRLMNSHDRENMKNIIVAKDETICMYVQGKYVDNTYTWMNVLVGKINNSKAWTWTSAFHEANKSWIQSLGGTKFALECIKDSRIDTYFTQATTDGVCLGSLTTEDVEGNLKRMTWEY